MSEEAPRQLSQENQEVVARLVGHAKRLGFKDPREVGDIYGLQESGSMDCPVCGTENIGSRNAPGYTEHFNTAHQDLLFKEQ